MAEVALVLVVNGAGGILLGRRRDNRKWTMPGGGLNDDEDPVVGAGRELFEETGLRPISMTPLLVQDPTPTSPPRLHVFSALCHGTPHSSHDPDDEVEEWKWVSTKQGLPAEVYDNLHGPQDDANVLKRLFDRAGGLAKDEESPAPRCPACGMKATGDRSTDHRHEHKCRSCGTNFSGPEDLNKSMRLYVPGGDCYATYGFDTTAAAEAFYQKYRSRHEDAYKGIGVATLDGTLVHVRSWGHANQNTAAKLARKCGGRSEDFSGEVFQKAELAPAAPSEVAELLRHPDPRERALALKLRTATPDDVATAVFDPHPTVWRAAFGHPDAAHALARLAGATHDAAGGHLFERHDLLLQDRRLEPGHVRDMQDAVMRDGSLPLDLQAQRLRVLSAHPFLAAPLQKHWAHETIASQAVRPVATPEHEQHMPHLGHLVEAYHQHVASADPIKPEDADLSDKGASPKVVYRMPVPGESAHQRFMVKPYHEAATPTSGWAEGTSQALYHAGGIGHLHQKSFVAPHGQGSSLAPALVIHLEDGRPVHRVSMDDARRQNPDLPHEARQVSLMDFLSGNADRHNDNLLLRHDGHLLAIDHGFSFNYANPYVDKEFSWYHHRSAPGIVAPGTTGAGAKWRDNAAEFRPAFAWWAQHSPAIRRAFDDRLGLIKEPHNQELLKRHFDARAAWLDARAREGVPQHADWHREKVTVPGEEPRGLEQPPHGFDQHPTVR